MNPISSKQRPTVKTLSTAEERRESLLVAAMPVFAEKGYHAAPTTEIAKNAGISQAYLFRLFPTKEELFVAAVERSCGQMLATFIEAADAADADGIDKLEQIGTAYGDLVGSNRDLLLVHLHGQAMSGYIPAVREAMRAGFAKLYAFASERTGASPEELQMWFASGMLINAMTAINAEEVDEPWAGALTAFEGDCFNS